MSTFKIVLITVLILIGIPVGCAVLSSINIVATAPSRVVNKILQTNNIIFNYERFFDVNARYTARVSQVKQYKDLYNTETDADERIRLRTDLGAMQQSCRDLATEYNADSKKLNRKIFKDNDLPYELAMSECE